MNRAASIRSKLLNIARKEGIAYQVVLQRYFHERFLYRLSISTYASQLLLKGGNLIYVWQGVKTRPTTDIDMLDQETSRDADEVELMIRRIAETSYPADGVKFDTGKLKIEVIVERNHYNGFRITELIAGLDSIRQPLQIDIGYGDKVSPGPLELEYPALLNEMPKPIVIAYTVESVIAEKLQAMFMLSTLNSRMKDFYDVYTIIKSGNYRNSILQNAIEITFENRNTPFIENHIILSDQFATDQDRNKMWSSYLRKINVQEELSFAEVMKTISATLQPIWEKIKIVPS